MITRKDLLRCTYDGNVCVRFDYELKDEKNIKQLEATFSRDTELSNAWNVWNALVIVGKTEISETQVYNFSFMLHSGEEVPLELVAATGLKMFRNQIVEEVQKKSAINFLLGEELREM